MDASANDVSNFQLSEVNAAFKSRSDVVFSCLDSIEAKHNAFEKKHWSSQSNFLKPDPTEEPIARKSTFKMPKVLPKRCRVPDYKLRPDKWKMYDLSNVSADQLSDSSNRITAQAFIDGLKKNSDTETADPVTDVEEDMTICSPPSFASNKKHLFKKPLKQTTQIKEYTAVEEKCEVNQVGPVLAIQQNDQEDEETNQEGSESASEMLTDCPEFHGRSLGGRKANIRPKRSTEDDDDDEEELQSDFQKPVTEDAQENQETAESDFSDHTAENTDEEDDGMGTEFGHAWSQSNRKEMQCEDQSDDEDVLKRAEGFAILDRSSCIFGQSGNCETSCTNGDSESLDDLDNID